MFSPNHRSRFQRCPVCAKDVHKVLLQQHVEVCLERSAGGASAGAGDASAGGWGRPRESARGDASGGGETSGRKPGCADERPSAGTDVEKTPFVTAGAFAERLGGRAPFAALRESNDGRGPFRRAGDATKSDLNAPNDAGAERRSVGLLGGFLRLNAKRRLREEPSRDEAPPRREKAARTDEGAEDERRCAFAASGGTPAAVAEDEKETKPNRGVGVLGDEEDRAEGDARGEGDADVERRRAESAVAVGDGGLMAFPVRVMSGDHRDCGICLQRFDARAGVERHVLWPCQHARQCGDCAIRIWQVPKSKRRCPWCKSKIDIRPRPFKPFL